MPKRDQVKRMGRKAILIDFPDGNRNTQLKCPRCTFFGLLRSVAFPPFPLKQLKKSALAATYIQGSPRTWEELLDPTHPIPGEKKPSGLKPGAEFPRTLPIIIWRIKSGYLFSIRAGTQKNQTTSLAFQVRKRIASRICTNIDSGFGFFGAEHAASFFHN